MHQRTLSRSDACGTMQHLVGGDVVQDEADGLCGIETGGYPDELARRQADELRIRAVDWHRGNGLSLFDSAHAITEAIHDADEIPPRREGHARRLGMNAFARHEIGQ